MFILTMIKTLQQYRGKEDSMPERSLPPNICSLCGEQLIQIENVRDAKDVREDRLGLRDGLFTLDCKHQVQS